MSSKYVFGTEHAAIYTQFRPVPPPELIENIMSYLNAKDFGSTNLALDVGCGSGQGTFFFAQHFKNVLGIDLAEAQLQEAAKKNVNTNVSFKVGPAEKLPVPDQSVQLVTASQACHWFDLPLFYEEVNRVLVPNGVLALFAYNVPSLIWKNKTDELTALFKKVFMDDIKEFWVAKYQLVLDEYTDEIFNMPFEDIYRCNDFYFDQNCTVTELAGLGESLSSFQGYKDAKGPVAAQELMDRFVEMVLKTMGETNPDEAKLTLHFPYFLLMGRKASS